MASLDSQHSLGSFGMKMVESDNVVTDVPAISLPAVDPEKLKARLYSHASQKPSPTLNKGLRFIRPTKAQIKTAAIPCSHKLEPLVCEFFCFVCHN